MKELISIGICLLFSLNSCSYRSEKQSESSQTSQNSSSNNYSIEENNEERNEKRNEYSAGCKFDDGTYNATVVYNNSKTGYSATYTLDIEVIGCQIVKINFPNGGYLDEDYITYADIDENGNATVDGEGGKTYEIQINN